MNFSSGRRRQLCLCFCAVLTAVLLWRWQRIFYLMCADYIRSDMPAHVALALGRNDYGLSSWLIRFLWGLKGEHFGQTLLSLVLTANQLLGIVTLWLLLRRLLPALDGAVFELFLHVKRHDDASDLAFYVQIQLLLLKKGHFLSVEVELDREFLDFSRQAALLHFVRGLAQKGGFA